jgi:hypothetical protein
VVASYAMSQEREAMRERQSRWLTGVGAVMRALLVAGCAASGTAGGSASHPALACTQTTAPFGIDVIKITLICRVTHAAASARSFSVHYSIGDASGHPFTLDTVCMGTLANGAGTCSETFSGVIPRALGQATVAGRTEPDGQPLGPVTLSG